MWYTINKRTWLRDKITSWQWSWWSILYNWASPTTETIWWLAAWTDISWWSHDAIFEEMLVVSSNPSVALKWTPSFQLYEIGDTIVDPLIEANWATGQWPVWVLTQLDIYRWNVWGTLVFSQANPTPWTRYWTNDSHTVNIIAWTSDTYSAEIQDDQWRSGTISKVYEWTYPYYATTNDIAVLDTQPLRSLTASYFSANVVAEWGWEKYKADFESSYITITWVEFFDTSSNSWKRMWGSKANSLLLRDTSNVNHTVQGNNVAYTRFTHNWPDGWALQLRFYTT